MFGEIDSIEVKSAGETRRIVLARGDLARIDPAQGVDLLVISALPDDYSETPTSLVGQLAARGVSVRALGMMKAMDLRETHGAWLSHPVEEAGFGRLVCFEPNWIGSPPKVVGQLFQALFPFLEVAEREEQVVAMPVISGGDTGWPLETMLPALLDAAAEWMRLGLPVSTLYVVTRDVRKVGVMQDVFAAQKAREAQKRRQRIRDGREEGPAEEIEDYVVAAARASASGDAELREMSTTGHPAPAPAGRVSHMGRVDGPLVLLLKAVVALAAVYAFVADIAGIAPEGLQVLLDRGLSYVVWFAGPFGLLWLVARIGRPIALSLRRRRNDTGRALSEVPDMPPPLEGHHHVFLSFSSKDAAAANRVAATLRAEAPELRIFDFRPGIPLGTSYQDRIDAALASCDRVLCILSPDYMSSGECKEELMIARLRNKRMDFELLVPVYWRGIPGDLALWLQTLNYADCREADEMSLDRAIRRIAASAPPPG